MRVCALKKATEALMTFEKSQDAGISLTNVLIWFIIGLGRIGSNAIFSNKEECI